MLQYQYSIHLSFPPPPPNQNVISQVVAYIVNWRMVQAAIHAFQNVGTLNA